MNIRKTILITFISFFLLGSLSSHWAWADNSIDNSLYGNLLKKYVKNGVVSYKGFKDEEDRLDEYLIVLENVDSLTLSPDEQFAFYVNAYNAWTIKVILTGNPGVKSIKDLEGKKDIIKIK